MSNGFPGSLHISGTEMLWLQLGGYECRSLGREDKRPYPNAPLEPEAVRGTTKTLGSVLQVETALVGHWIIGANEPATLERARRDMSPNCHVWDTLVQILNCVDLDLELPLICV